jgi:hypothetical protein
LKCADVEFDCVCEVFGTDVGLGSTAAVQARCINLIVLFEDNDGEYGFFRAQRETL